MLTSATKRFILPFSARKNSSPEVEAAAVFAVAELERNKGGGFITRQLEEKLAFISKAGYPIWLFPKNDLTLVFDGLGDSSYSIHYAEVPSAKAFMDSLEANSLPREKYIAFLSDHGNYFQQSTKDKQFMFRGLIVDSDVKSEFNVYRMEAAETTTQTDGAALFSPTREETAISSMVSEFDKLQAQLREDAERLPECLRLVNKTTSQYLTEIDFEAAAATEETNAKLKAQEELVKPQIAKLNKEYNCKIKDLAESFDTEIESLKKLKVKTQKAIESSEEKIRLYQREAKAQAAKKHTIYEKRWKEKNKQTEKELKSLKKELKNAESNIKKVSKQKAQEISKLNFEFDAEVKLARQPLLELEAARDAKMRSFKQETEKLLSQERPVIEGLNRNIKLREAIKASFEALGIRSQDVKVPALFYVPFYMICYEMGSARRYLIIPPSTVTSVDFSAKLKGALGMSKIKNLFTPRFKAITTLIGNVQMLAKQNSAVESQIYELGQRSNLLTNSLFSGNVQRGLVYLKHQGWLSDKEQQILSNRLSA